MTDYDRPESGNSLFPARFATARLELRMPRLDDAKAIAALANNMAIAEMTARIPHPYGLNDAGDFIEQTCAAFARAPAYMLAERASGVPVGACGFGPCEETRDSEIGYWIGQPFWGMGYATEAAQAVVDLFFSRGHADLLFGACRVTNRGSRRVLEKCGFQRCGEGMIASRALGGMVPVHRYRLERGIWHSLKRWRSVHPDASGCCSPMPV